MRARFRVSANPDPNPNPNPNPNLPSRSLAECARLYPRSATTGWWSLGMSKVGSRSAYVGVGVRVGSGYGVRFGFGVGSGVG